MNSRIFSLLFFFCTLSIWTAHTQQVAQATTLETSSSTLPAAKREAANNNKVPKQKKRLAKSAAKRSPAKHQAKKSKTPPRTLVKASQLLAMPAPLPTKIEAVQKIPTPTAKMPSAHDPILDSADVLDDDDDDEDDDDDDEAAEEATPAPPNKKIMIRVLLKEFATDQKVTFAIQSNRGFVLESPIASGKRARWPHEIINLLAHKHNLFLLTENGTYKRIKANELAIASIDGDLKIDNLRYTGAIYLRIDPQTKMIQIVNKVNLDDYIYAVLRSESLPYWPAEMQKVQAIASRTYAVRQIKLTRSNATNTPFYDIKNNNSHQVYHGNHSETHLRTAVNATHNLILTYNGDIALTMFDICCGGIIPGAMKKRDADKPYLFRKNRCTFCRDNVSYEWHCALDKDRLLNRLLESPKTAAKAKKIGTITGISLREKDRANIVHRILIHGSRNNISFTNNEFKSVLQSKARSNAYAVKMIDGKVDLHGYGYGHHMGLCQIGARELVSRGKKYPEILDFYFPKTKLMRLKVI
jgi:stage II sporulation protein D